MKLTFLNFISLVYDNAFNICVENLKTRLLKLFVFKIHCLYCIQRGVLLQSFEM